FLRIELILAIVGGEHAFVADKQYAQSPTPQWLARVIIGLFDEVVMSAAIGPMELNGWLLAPGGKVVAGLAPTGRAVGMDFRSIGREGGRIGQTGSPEGEVHHGGGHVAERAGTVFPKPAPVGRMNVRRVGALFGRTEPQVPLEVGGGGLIACDKTAVGPTL